MADIDFFKKVNDTYGHQAGDEILNFVAQTIFRSVRHDLKRPMDLLGRFGGEEFLLILKNIPYNITLQRIENIRKKIEATTIKHNDDLINVTTSFGIVHVLFDNIKV